MNHTRPSRSHERPSGRPFTRFVALALLTLAMPVFAFATAIAATGTVTVNLHEKDEDGTRLFVPVPALLIDIAVLAAPLVIPDEHIAEMRAELAPYREGLQSLARELENCPQGVLVEVESRGETVRVSKNWRSFEIEIDDHDTDLRVSVPSRLASRLLDVI